MYQHCAPEPGTPGHGATNGTWGEYVLDLRAAGADCRAKVDGGRVYQQEQRRLNTEVVD